MLGGYEESRASSATAGYMEELLQCDERTVGEIWFGMYAAPGSDSKASMRVDGRGVRLLRMWVVGGGWVVGVSVAFGGGW